MKFFFYSIAVVLAATCPIFNLSHAAEEALQGEAFTGVISGDRVNVRADDSTSSEVICQLGKGDEVSVMGLKGKWY